MIGRREILDAAGTLGLLPHVVEKDDVPGWVLAGIYRRKPLAESRIFKGGTCLKKCYFQTHRFSEDLDFTLTEPSQIDRGFLAVMFAKSENGSTNRPAASSPKCFTRHIPGRQPPLDPQIFGDSQKTILSTMVLPGCTIVGRSPA